MKLAHKLRIVCRSLLRGGRRPQRKTLSTRLAFEPLEERVVPTLLFASSKIPAPSFPERHGIQVIQRVDVDLIFWGPQWTQGGIDDRPYFGAVLDILGSHYLDGLRQPYGVAGVGTVRHNYFVSDSKPPASIDRQSVLDMLTAKLNDGTIEEPNSDVDTAGFSQILYVVVPQPQTTIAPGVEGARTGGEHASAPFRDGEDEASSPNFERSPQDTDDDPINMHFAYVENRDSNLNSFTQSFSHELVEAITDPEGTSWRFNAANNRQWEEIGDGDAQNYTFWTAGHLVQSYWSPQYDSFLGSDGTSQRFAVTDGVLAIHGDQRQQAQPTSNDSLLVDTFAVDPKTNVVQITLDDEMVRLGPGVIKSITVDLRTGADSITVLATLPGVPVTITGGDTVLVGAPLFGVDHIQSVLTLKKAPHHATDFTVNDGAAPKSRKAVFGQKTILGLAAMAINFDPAGLKSLNVITGVFPNLLEFDDTPSSTVKDVTTAVPTTLNVFGIADVVNVNATSGPLLITTFLGKGTINVAKGNVKTIKGPLTVLDLPLPFPFPRFQGIDLTVDDHTDRPPQDVTLDDKALVIHDQQAKGATTATILFEGANLHSLTVLGGFGGNKYLVSNTPSSTLPDFAVKLKSGATGDDRFTVTGTTGPLILDGFGGTDTITLGDPAKGLAPLKGAVAVEVIDATGGSVKKPPARTKTATTQLIVDDSADTAGRTVGVTDKAITGMPSAAITYDPALLSSLTVNGGSGADKFTITPSQLVSFVLNGNAPATSPGDVLSLTDKTGASQTSTGKGSGTITFSDKKVKTIQFTGMEELPLP